MTQDVPTVTTPTAPPERPDPGDARLARVVLREVELPLVEPFRISSGVTTVRRILLLELEDSDGVRSWSECVAGDLPNYSPETIDTAWLAISSWLAPKLIGRTVPVAEAGALLDRGVRGHRMAKAALEMGLWGLAAERLGVGLATLLGGSREEIETGISLGIQETPEALVDRAAAALEEGYRKIKIKIQPGDDRRFLLEVRRRLGDDAPLMADANSAYDLESTGPDGLAALEALDDLGLVMIEQPLGWDDLRRHAFLQERLQTPVCLDESITGPAAAEDMIALEAGRIVNIKPGRVGGFASSLAIHDLCRDAGIPVWCGGMLESGIGRAYNVALASLPGFTIPGDVSPSARYWARDVVEPEWTMTDGRVRVPTASGLGVTVDGDRIDGLTSRRHEVS